ncbi:MAG: FAD binding domain-containing protein [Burkholderiaceae bacterium]
MKSYNFSHVAPQTLDEVVALLNDHPGEAKIISGGQSLMPVLNFRLAKPDLLVDLRNVNDLNIITCSNHETSLGARVRWVDIEKSTELAFHQPLLQKALSYVAHYQIRNRGTIGGSLANCDPAAELPLIALVLEARIKVINSKGYRYINIADFFLGFMSTSLSREEVIVELILPNFPSHRKWGFEEFSRRKGDFAIAACAVWFDLSPLGKMENAHIGVIGADDYPIRLTELENTLNNKVFTSELLNEAIPSSLNHLSPPVDPQISQAYRLSLITTMIKRAFANSMSKN